MSKIYIGYDSREPIAFFVCEHSLEVYSSTIINIQPLIKEELKSSGIYERDIDPLSSTEFTFTRFLVPYLMNYQGWALFCDCDFLWIDDVNKLFSLVDEQYAVMVVKHEYVPENILKMDNQVQYRYPRKNWSSMILWNCGHESNKVLTPEVINTKLGSYLHQFQWLKDEEIGEVSPEWNWLVGWNKEGSPKAIHYTEGGPYFVNYFDCEYAQEWKDMYKNLYGTDFLINNCIDYKK